MDIASCAASSGLVATDIFILQTNANPAVSKRITGAQLISGINTNTEYTPGTNINIPANNSINLNTTLTGLNSVSSTNNTDLKLQSTGNGDILLKANATNTTVGKILLSRIDNDAIRFNTIEYGNNANLSYIKFLVHRDDNTNTLTREVLKLNSDLSSTFAGSVTASSFIGTAGNNLDIKTTTNNDIIFSQNNNSIMKISSNGITALNSKQFFGSFSGGANNLILETGLSSGVATNIIFKTNEVQRALISSTKLDLEVDVDLASGKSYKINGTAINKSTVGLSNVDNTSDASKPISTATQSALTAINASNIVYKTGTQSIGGVKTFTSKVNIQAPSGYAKLEIGGPSGVLIDLKKPFSDDFECKLHSILMNFHEHLIIVFENLMIS